MTRDEDTSPAAPSPERPALPERPTWPPHDDGLVARLEADGLEHWLPAVPDACRDAVAPGRHGDLQRWKEALYALPAAHDGAVSLDGAAVTVGSKDDLGAAEQAQLQASLEALRPWRKGPFSLYGIDIDAEWRSDLKFARLQEGGLDFDGARVLDVGCGNGYYAWRMRGAGARRVIGVDPTLVHMMQFAACRHFLPDPAVDLLPIPMEVLPHGRGSFDIVCSMGVLYHRRSPIDHLAALVAEVAPGGRLVIESIVVDGDADRLLCPPGRYARMRNVWFLPSAALIVRWLERLGCVDVHVLDESPTLPEEQRSTAWMPFESLAAALDPSDPTRTVEGHPAPRRAVVVGTRAR